MSPAAIQQKHVKFILFFSEHHVEPYNAVKYIFMYYFQFLSHVILYLNCLSLFLFKIHKFLN